MSTNANGAQIMHPSSIDSTNVIVADKSNDGKHQILIPNNFDPDARSSQRSDDLFNDLSKLRINQNFNDVGVKKAVLHIPVRKPTSQEFIRVHPAENMRLDTTVIELKDDREVFLILPELAQALHTEVRHKLLVTAINKQGVLFLWPINLDLNDERMRKNHWNESAREAADYATRGWVRVQSNMSLGAYDVLEASGNFSEPSWPNLSFEQILRIAFKDKIISTFDHTVIRKLRGEIE